MALFVPIRGKADLLEDCLETWDPETIFATCTPAIESGRWSGQEVSEAYFRRGLGHYGIDDYAPAIADFDRAFELWPDNSEILYFRGITHRLAGHHASSIADLTELIRREPDHAGAYNNRALAYAQTKQYEKALADYDEALRVSPTLPSALVGRGRVLLELGEPARALRDYEATLQRIAKMEADYRSRGLYDEWRRQERAEAEAGRAEAMKALGRPVAPSGPAPRGAWPVAGVHHVWGRPAELARCAVSAGRLPGSKALVTPDGSSATILGPDGWYAILLQVEEGVTSFAVRRKDNSEDPELTRRVESAMRDCAP